MRREHETICCFTLGVDIAMAAVTVALFVMVTAIAL